MIYKLRSQLKMSQSVVVAEQVRLQQPFELSVIVLSQFGGQQEVAHESRFSETYCTIRDMYIG